VPDNENRYNMLDSSDRAEAIRVKKLKQGLVSNTENEEYQKEKEKRENTPLSFWEKIANYWYHFKPVIIFAAILLVIVGYLVYQALNRETYDTTIMLHTNTYYSSANLEVIGNAFKEFMPDADKNGKIEIGVLQSKEMDEKGDSVIGLEGALKARLVAEITAGKNCIFVVEESLISSLNELGVFADLRETLSIESDSAVYSIPLKDSTLLKDRAFDSVRDKYYICLRVYKEDSDKEQYNYQVEAVKNIYKQISK